MTKPNGTERPPSRVAASGPERQWLDRAGVLAVVGLPLLALYGLTASRDIGTIDSGELGAACATLGIAHPTGYPLYTQIGRLAVLAWPGRPIMAVILLSAIATAAAAVLTSILARDVLRWLRPDPRTRPGGPDRNPAAHLWLAWGAGLWIGTNLIFWDQATGNEVYATHMVFVALLALLGQRLLLGGDRRLFLVFAWVSGLAFCHHLSIVFLSAALLLACVRFLWIHGAFGRRTPGRGARSTFRPGFQETGESWDAGDTKSVLALLGIAAGLFLLAWTSQLYLPIRSAREPLLDWGDPTSWRRFWRHVLAGQYRVWFFESGHLWWENLLAYLRSLPSRFSWPVLGLSAAGLYRLIRGNRVLLAYHGLIFLLTVVWAASYSIHDLEPYFLPADLVLGVLACAGAEMFVALLARRLPNARSLQTWAAAVGVLVIAGLQIQQHFAEADRRQDHLVRYHAEAVLRSLPPDAILISRHWDGLVSASIYLQVVEHLRPDVTVVDSELLRRSWYYDILRRRDPDLLRPMEDRVRAFLNQAILFEEGKPYNPAAIQAAYVSVLDGIAQLHRPRRPTCFTPDVETTFLRGAAPVPEGLVFLLRDDVNASPALAPPDVAALEGSGFRADDLIHRQVAEEWATMSQARVRYLEAMGRSEEAIPWKSALADLAGLLKDAGPGAVAH